MLFLNKKARRWINIQKVNNFIDIPSLGKAVA
jgi:hypothetical protein